MTHTVHAPPAAAIGAVLAGRLVQPVFQPIVDLGTRAVVGVEALARGPAGTELQAPDRLFAAARDAGVVGDLDLLCSERALEEALAAPVAPPLVFVNAEPGVLDQPLSPRLIELVRSGLPFREVLEFTERSLPAVPGSLLRIAGQVQHWGNGLALDDVGVDPMSLAFLPVLEPEVIKLDMGLLRDPDGAHTRSVCAVVRAEAGRTGAVVVAEGIETEADLRTARSLGAHWGQGWLFGRPGRIGTATHRYDPGAADALRRPRPGFHDAVDTPLRIVAGHGTVVPATAGAVTAALARLRDLVAAEPAAVVVVCRPGDAGVDTALRDLAGQARSVIVLDEPIGDETAVVVLGAGRGAALATRPGGPADLAVTDHLPTVAALARALLSRLP